MKPYPDCPWCKGEGRLIHRCQIGFFDYAAGAECPTCISREQAEISRKAQSQYGFVAPEDNMMALRGMDTSDSAAFTLLEKIARKSVEPMSEDSDPNKTLGECRKELTDLLFEAVQFVATRNSRRSAAG